MLFILKNTPKQIRIEVDGANGDLHYRTPS